MIYIVNGICYNLVGLDRWLPIRPAHKDHEISGEVLVALRLEKVFTATDPATEKVCNIVIPQYLHICLRPINPVAFI